MMPRLVTFDCAQTLVSLPEGWTLGDLVRKSAYHIGLDVNSDAATTYDRLYYSRIHEFVELNMRQDLEGYDRFWNELGLDWLEAVKLPKEALGPLREAADELCFGQNSIVFSLYEDVLACLDQLDSLGIRCAVVSNWDYSLHRVLRMFDLYERFITVKASLEEGVEKPDPRLFHLTLATAGFEASETFHVGDNPVDDVEGARAAGIRTVLLDRTTQTEKGSSIQSLRELVGAFSWTD